MSNQEGGARTPKATPLDMPLSTLVIFTPYKLVVMLTMPYPTHILLRLTEVSQLLMDSDYIENFFLFFFCFVLFYSFILNFVFLTSSEWLKIASQTVVWRDFTDSQILLAPPTVFCHSLANYQPPHSFLLAK